MDVLIRVAKNAMNLDGNKIVHDSLDNTLIQQQIIELNTDTQLLEQGVFADGTPTGPYAANTIEGTKYYKGKKEKGQPYNHITFRDTGAMLNTEKFVNGKTQFELKANTVKDGVDLEDRYGNPIIGLTEKSLEETQEMILPIMRDKTLNDLRK